MVAHDENFAISLTCCLFVEFKRSPVEPVRASFLVIPERKPEPPKLSDLFVVCTSAKIDDVCDAQVLELFDVTPCSYRTAKGQPFSHEESFHSPPPFPGVCKSYDLQTLISVAQAPANASLSTFRAKGFIKRP